MSEIKSHVLHRLLLTLLIAPLSIFATGCADKNIDDAQRDYALQQASKNQAIAGTYRGAITSTRDQAYMGDASLVITPDTRPITAQNGLSPGIQAVISAKVVITRASSSLPKEFQNCSYDSKSGSFSCQDSTNTLKLGGTIQGDTFVGSIEAVGSPNYGGQVSLSKNQPSASVSSIQGRLGSSSSSKPMTHVYTGTVTYADGWTPSVFSLVLVFPEATTDQAFNNLFEESKSVDASLTTPGNRIVFSNANLQEAVGTLMGVSAPVADGVRMHLNCVKNANAAFICDYFTDANAYVFSKVIFTPTSSHPNSGAVPGKQTQ